MILCLRIAGYGLCILPALFSSLEHFPLWFSEKETALSILGLLLLALVALPLWKTVKQALKSPSAWVVWLLLWLFLSLFRHIIDGLITVSLVAFPFSMLGAVLFALARRYEKKKT